MEPLEYQLNEEDLVQWNLYYAESSKTFRRGRVRFRISAIWFLLGAGAVLVIGGFSPVALVFLCAGIAWWFASPVLHDWTIKRRLQRLVKESASSLLKGPITLALQDDGLYNASCIGESLFRFDAIEDIVEKEGYTYLLMGKAQALILPHDRLGKETVDAFVAEVERRREVPPGAAAPE